MYMCVYVSITISHLLVVQLLLTRAFERASC